MITNAGAPMKGNVAAVFEGTARYLRQQGSHKVGAVATMIALVFLPGSSSGVPIIMRILLNVGGALPVVRSPRG
jgi:hypothetical protein